jgi:hypothetical protein
MLTMNTYSQRIYYPGSNPDSLLYAASLKNFELDDYDMDWNEGTMVEPFSVKDCFGEEGSGEQGGEMEFAPYPLDSTEEEIEDLNELQVSLGQGWTFDIAKNLCEEVGAGEDMDEGMAEEYEDGSSQVTPNNSFSESEPKELRQLRNQLWRQSLKSSLFHHQEQQSS